MASDLLIIVDDTSSDFQFLDESLWTTSNSSQWYGSSARSPDGSSTSGGSFTFSFEGTSVAFYGLTPAPPASQSFSVSIDGSEPHITACDDPSPPSSVQWYQSPELPDGKHTVTASLIDGATLDYAAVGVGLNTPLSGKKAVVDDDSSLVEYKGGWAWNTGGLDAGSGPGGSPFHNGTHRSWTAGDGFSFNFTGTSLEIYGLFSWNTLGVFTATYTLDEITVSQTYSASTSSPEYINNVGDASNYLYFSDDTLPAGEHTLVMSITQCNNQSFILDYITYTPSFQSFASLPSKASTLTPSKTSIGGKATDPLTSTIPIAASQQPGKKTSVVAVVGGVIGALAFLSLIVVLGLLVRRHRRSKKRKKGKRLGSRDYIDPSRPLMAQGMMPPPSEFGRRMIASSSRLPSNNSLPSEFHLPGSYSGAIRASSSQERLEELDPAGISTRPVLTPILTQKPSSSSSLRHYPGHQHTHSVNTLSFDTPLDRPLTPLRREDIALTRSPSPSASASFTSRARSGSVPLADHRQWTSSSGDFGSARSRIVSDGMQYGQSDMARGRTTPMRRAFPDSFATDHHRLRGTGLSSSQANLGEPYEMGLLFSPVTPPDLAGPTGIYQASLSQDGRPTLAEAGFNTSRPVTPQRSGRLTPVRPTFPEVQIPPSIPPAQHSPAPSLSSLLPRFNLLLRRGSSQTSPTDVPVPDSDYDDGYTHHTPLARHSRTVCTPSAS